MLSATALITVLATLPFTSPQYEVKEEHDVVYAQADGFMKSAREEGKGQFGEIIPQLWKKKTLDLDMDIYTPEGDNLAQRPLLLMMHGGSFLFGNKEEKGQTAWCKHFASLGYVAVSINYRIGFHLKKKEITQAELWAMDDANAAISYLLSREDLKINPEWIFAAGTSAGGITALNIAFRKPEHKIKAIACLWGSMENPEDLKNSRTAILSYQSEHDPVMPYGAGYPFQKKEGAAWPPSWLYSHKMYGTGAIYGKAQEAGLRVEHHPVPGNLHRLHIGNDGEFTPIFYEIQDRMAEFFAEEIGKL